MSSTITDDKIKKVTKFDPPGMNFKAKLIGLEDVTDPRGDKMCQVAMAKLKAAVVAIGDHKQRITVNISLEGIKILDEKTESVLHQHPVHRISFISRDVNDSRAFGYVYNREDGVHQFVGIKTEKAAEPLVTSLRDLFQTVVEMRKEKEKENGKTENSLNTAVTEDKKSKEENEPEKKPPPASTDLLGLEQGVSQMNAFGSASSAASSNAWLDSNLFQTSPSAVPFPTTIPVVAHPGPMPSAANSYVTQGPPGVASIAVASALYQQPQYPQQIPVMPNAAFGSYPTSFPSQNPAVVAGVGMQSPWQPTQPPAAAAVFRAPGAEVIPTNPSWMSFDSSAQISSIFGDLSSQQTTSVSGFSSAPFLQPTSANDPFATSAKFPDPFADLAVLPSQGAAHAQSGKKVSKEDFIKEPPKQTLLDLSQLQQQQTGLDITIPVASSVDPFSAVSPPKNQALVNPFLPKPPESQDVHHLFVPNVASLGTLDKSRAGYASAPNFIEQHGFSDSRGHTEALTTQRSASTEAYAFPEKSDHDDVTSGQVSRPRPKGNAGTRPALILPLAQKVKQGTLCMTPLEQLHDKKYSRNTYKHPNFTPSDKLPAGGVNAPNCHTLSFIARQKFLQSENAGNAPNCHTLSFIARQKFLPSENAGKSFYNAGKITGGKSVDYADEDKDKTFEELWQSSVAPHEDEETPWYSPNISKTGKHEGIENASETRIKKSNAVNILGKDDQKLTVLKNDQTLTALKDDQNLTTIKDDQKLTALKDDQNSKASKRRRQISNISLACSGGLNRCGPKKDEETTQHSNNLVDSDAEILGDIGKADSCEAQFKMDGSTFCQSKPTERFTSTSLSRRNSARRTTSLNGLVTIREETDLPTCHPTLQPTLSAGATSYSFLPQTPSLLSKYILENDGHFVPSSLYSVGSTEKESYLKINPFAGVDPFVTETVLLGDPFEGENGRPVSNYACAAFDLLQEEQKLFCTRAITVDFLSNAATELF